MNISKLDDFTKGYVEAMFFTDCHHDNPELEYKTVDDLAPETLEKMIEDCAAFRASLLKDESGQNYLDLAYDCAARGYDETQAGHDFWFTRNGHGVGFWDRGLGVVGEKLSEACGFKTEWPPLDVYAGDDGKLYIA